MQFKKIREKFLIVLAAVFALLLVWACISLTTFLVSYMDKSLSFQPKNMRATEFDTAGFEKLNLSQEK